MRSGLWRAITALARTQHGLVSTRQVHDTGASDQAIARAVAAGLLQQVRRCVYLVTGVPESCWQPLMAACLAAGNESVASHRAAAALYGLPGIQTGHVELLATSAAADLGDVRCHRTRRLPRDHCASVLNIPCTSPDRTIVDIAGIVHPFLLRKIVDYADHQRVCHPDQIAACLDLVGSRGRRGTKTLREILHDYVGGDSHLETSWLRSLKKAGLVPPALQHQVVVHGRVYLLDLAWPHQRVGLEVDGWEHHRSRNALDHGATRGNLLLEAGWRIVHVTSRSTPSEAIRQLRAFLAEK